MKNKYMIFAMAIVACICLCTNVWAAGAHGHKAEKKVGILLVAIGSSEDSAQVSVENIDKKVKSAYPGIPVRWAYTSVIIRDKLAKQGKQLDSPEVAFARMMDEKFTHVAVQTLHTIGGSEYHDLRRTVGALRDDPQRTQKRRSRCIDGARHPPPLQCILCRLDVSASAQRSQYFCGHG